MKHMPSVSSACFMVFGNAFRAPPGAPRRSKKKALKKAFWAFAVIGRNNPNEPLEVSPPLSFYGAGHQAPYEVFS